MADVYQIPEKILYETIEGEVIAMDMQSGSYFSLRHTAASIWSLLLQSVAIDEIITQITDCYRIDRQVVSADLQSFLGHLQEEGLIEVTTLLNPEKTPSQLPRGTEPYTAPALEVFTDVQDLLTIDPIHDVDEMGWPQPKQMAL